MALQYTQYAAALIDRWWYTPHGIMIGAHGPCHVAAWRAQPSMAAAAAAATPDLNRRMATRQSCSGHVATAPCPATRTDHVEAWAPGARAR